MARPRPVHADGGRRATGALAQQLIDALPVHVALLDEHGVVVAVNSAWRRFGERSGASRPGFGPGASYLEVCEARSARRTEGPQVAHAIRTVLGGAGAPFQVDYPCDGPDGRRWFRARVAPVAGEGPVRVLVQHEDVTALRSREGVDVAAMRLTPAKAAEAERQRIARGLHDSTSQQLAAAMLDIDCAMRLLGASGSGACQVLNEAATLCSRSLAEVRSLSYELSPPLLRQLGLVAALRAQVAAFSLRSGIAVRLEAPAPRRLPANAELALFRVAEEALGNVQRHAGCRSATVRLVFGRGVARLEVQDRGRGIAATPGRPVVGGQGVEGMRERVGACGGRLQIFSPGRGTVVRAVVPIRRASDREHPAR